MYCPLSSTRKALYDPKAFIAHAALLPQTFVHWAIFPTAASRRSLARVSVPVWLVILSDQLPVIGLVSRYLTNYLMGRSPLLQPRKFLQASLFGLNSCGISCRFQQLSPAEGQVSYVLRTRSPLRYCYPRSTCMY